jgi:hypothetical protein
MIRKTSFAFISASPSGSQILLSAILVAMLTFGCSSMLPFPSIVNHNHTNDSDASYVAGPALLPARQYGHVWITFAQFAMERSPLSDQTSNSSIRLWIGGVRGISRDKALLYGSLSVGAGDIRCLILLTADGGRSWREVMVPEELSTTSELFFLGDGIGWAVVLRTPEGIESANLYQTYNHGRNWQLVGPLPNHGQGSFQTLGLRFADLNHGEIWAETIDYVDGGHEREQFCLCTTNDGGITWTWTSMCCEADKAEFKWLFYGISTANDGTQWRRAASPIDSQYSQWIVYRTAM